MKLFDPATVALVASGRTTLSQSVNGWFGPLQPMPPVAPAGTQPRTWDYPVGFNLQVKPKAAEGIDCAALRDLARYDIIRVIIENRKEQLLKTPWTITLKKVPGETAMARKQRALRNEHLAELSEFFVSPDRENGWQTWMRKILEDLFVIDQVAILPRRTMAGGIYSLDVIDAATISRKVDEGGRTPVPPYPAYQQIIKGMPAVDITTDQLVYWARNLRSNHVYGYSPVEWTINTISVGIRRLSFQLSHFTEGNVPMAIAQVKDSLNWSRDQIKQFQVWFDTLANQPGIRSKMYFVPEMGNITFPKDDILKDTTFDEWVARVLCFALGMSPQPFIKEMNRATAQQAQENAQQQGEKPTLDWIAELINFLISRFFGYTDVEFAFQDDADVDPAQQATIDATYVKGGIRTPNEIRHDHGWDPMPEGDKLGVITGNGFIRLDMTLDGPASGLAPGDEDEQPAQKLAKVKKKRPY